MIVWEIDWRSPYEAFAPLAGAPHAHLLHGGDRSETAEWSIIAAFPADIVSTNNVVESGNVFDALNERINERKIIARNKADHLPFISGHIGFAGYEAARFLEPTLRMPPSAFGFPDLVFGAYDAAAVFSRRARTAYIAGRDVKACRRLRGALGKERLSAPSLQKFGPPTSNFKQTRYEACVRTVIEQIREGDYYQANISHQINALAEAPVDAFSLFRRLASNSDAQFGALMQFPEGAVISNSPERFFRIGPPADGRRIVAEPIKGTRPRGAAPAEDNMLAQELLNDPKDRAENIMIADLMRNDLSRICRDGAVREEAICELMKLANVHHLLSRISGVLRDDISFVEVLSALFPCGSVTGAPKIEAMNAIASFERKGRGPYCGAIGYVDDGGAADFSVAIRTMMLTEHGRRLTIPVGGGVTLRSDPHKEYHETIVKASAAFDAIGKSHQELL